MSVRSLLCSFVTDYFYSHRIPLYAIMTEIYLHKLPEHT